MRLDALERSNSRLKLALGGIVLASLLTVVGWQSARQPEQELIRTRALEIVSADGKTLVKLGYDSWTSGGALTVFDNNGARRGWLRGGPSGGNLGVLGEGAESASVSAILSIWRKRATLSMANPASGHLTTYALDAGTASLTIHDKKGSRVMTTSKIK